MGQVSNISGKLISVIFPEIVGEKKREKFVALKWLEHPSGLLISNSVC
jgi:hypothetical protein